MRLLFYIDTMSGGGAERVMATVTTALADEHEVYLATDLSKPCSYTLSEKIHLVDYKEGFPKVSRSVFNKVYRRYWLFHRYRQLAKLLKADVAVSFKTQVNCDIIFSLLFSGIPLVCCEHTNILRKRPLDWRLKRAFLYPFASCITLLTKHDLKVSRRRPWKMVRMPNPCDVPNREVETERKKVVFTAGRVDDWNVKGYDLLIKAWGKLYRKYPDWKLQIAGNYSEKTLSFLRSIAPECCDRSVEFLGFRRDVYDLMAQSSAYCLSSRIEGLPMGLLEAMASGCCCVAFDCITGPNEIIKDGQSGLLAKAEDVGDLSLKLESVILNPDLCTSLASNAPKSAFQYSTAAVARRWNILFKKLVKK